MKKLAIVVVGLIVLAVAAVFLAPSVIDFKPLLASRVKAATGRDLRIDGALKISLLPSLSVSAAGVHLSNAPGMKAPEMVAVDAVALQAELWPLIGGHVAIDRLTVTNPTVNLEVDKAGTPNWAFAPAGGPVAPAPASASSGGGALAGLSLGDIKVAGGHVSYSDDTTGQTIEAKSIALDAAMAAISTPLTLKGQLTLNDEPVTADLAIDSLGKLQQGQQAKVKLALNTKQLTAGFDGSAQQQPVPGLNGTFDLNVGSVGALFSWLHRPLDKSQPDPGALKVHAVFASSGAKSALQEASIQGTALKVTASGSLDASGPVNKLSLTLDSGLLDLDRYLPPPRTTAIAAPAHAMLPAPGKAAAAAAGNGFDLSALRKTDADVKVTVAGVKARGLELGRLAFTATDKGGNVEAQLSELSLYGGKVSGTVKLDATKSAPAVAADLKIEHVTVDKLAALAGVQAAGAVSASLDGSASGADMRAAAASLSGKLALDLAGVSSKTAALPGISGLTLNVDVPGPGKPPTLQASLTYKGEKVDTTATLGPLQQLMDGGKFPAKLALTSPLVSLKYDGNLQQQPVAVDGTFDLDVGSVAKLAAWLGQPLEAKQPDPGPLQIHAALASDGGKTTLKDATITGKAIKVAAAMQYDGTQKIPAATATLDVQQADIDAYLPPSTAGAAAPAQKGPAPAARAAGWSSEPFDTAPLGAMNLDATVKLANTHYRGLDITQGQIKAAIADKVLTVTVDKLALSHGTVDMKAAFNAAGAVPKLDYQMSVSGVEALQLMKALAGSSRLSGTMAGDTTISGSGRSEKELVATLNGKGQFKVTNGAIHGINIASALRNFGTAGFAGGQTEQTDFAELSGTYTMKDGVLSNSDLKMLAPLVRLSGKGTVPFPPQTIDYTVEADLVATTQGQGGAQGLTGVPIPIKITGPWSNPSYQPDINILKSLPGALGNVTKGLGVPGIPGLPGGQTSPGGTPQVPGSVTKTLKGLFGK